MEHTVAGEKLMLRRYRKKALPRCWVRSLDIAPVGTVFTVPTLEGAVQVTAGAELYIMVGAFRDPYPISRAHFEASYQSVDGDTAAAEAFLAELGWAHAAVHCCVPLRPYYVYAAPVKQAFRVYLENHRYTLQGAAGDYYAVPEEDPAAPYIIRADIMEKTYTPAEAEE